MVLNFLAGGAAISVLAKQLKAQFKVVNCGVAEALSDAPGLVNDPIALGTQDFSLGPAMTHEQCLAAMALGAAQVHDLSLIHI